VNKIECCNNYHLAVDNTISYHNLVTTMQSKCLPELLGQITHGILAESSN